MLPICHNSAGAGSAPTPKFNGLNSSTLQPESGVPDGPMIDTKTGKKPGEHPQRDPALLAARFPFRTTTATPRAVAARVLGLLVAMLVCPQIAQADNWMFRPSYYSHAPLPGQPTVPVNQRSAYRQPFAGNHPHAAIRGGFRYNSMVLSNSQSVDRTVIRENWFDLNY